MPISWPTDLGKGTITGRFGWMRGDQADADRDPDLGAATGTIVVTPSVPVVTYNGTSGRMVLAHQAVTGVLDGEGWVCTPGADGKTPGPRGLILPATDDDNLTPTGFTYQISVRLEGATIPPYSIALPTGSVVDLATVTPVPTSGGTAVVVDGATADRAEEAAERAVEAANSARDLTEQPIIFTRGKGSIQGTLTGYKTGNVRYLYANNIQGYNAAQPLATLKPEDAGYGAGWLISPPQNGSTEEQNWWPVVVDGTVVRIATPEPGADAYTMSGTIFWRTL